MNERKITVAMVEAYDRKLKEDEHAVATREKYLRSVRAFAVWLDGAAVTKEAVTEWKAHLAERRQASSTDTPFLQHASQISHDYICANAGAVDKIYNSIFQTQ